MFVGRYTTSNLEKDSKKMLGRLNLKLGSEEGYDGGGEMYLMLYRKVLSTVRIFFCFYLFFFKASRNHKRPSGYAMDDHRTNGTGTAKERKRFRICEILFRECSGYELFGS